MESILYYLLSRDCHRDKKAITKIGGGEVGIAIWRRRRSQKWVEVKPGDDFLCKRVFTQIWSNSNANADDDADDDVCVNRALYAII
jgi:hypothetical protein